MDNPALNDFVAIGELFNFSKFILLISASIFLWLCNSLLKQLSQHLMDAIPSKRFLILQTTTLMTFLWYFIGAYWMIAGILQPPKELLLAIGGSAVVATGFALKDIAASLIAGLILLFDRPFQVGDRVSFNDTYGEIVSIGLRSVRLSTLDDNLVTIPNARFITDVVSSGNAGELDMMVVCDFHLALEADLQQAQSLIHEAIVTSRYAYLKKSIDFVVSEVVIADKLAICIKAKSYVLDVHYEKAYQSDVVSRVSQLFAQYGVKRPITQLQRARQADLPESDTQY